MEIIVKNYKNGFISHYLNHDLKINDEVTLEIGLGDFNYELFRDKKNLTFIAGGAGITPFISIANDILIRKLDVNMIIIYGSDNPNQIIAKKEMDELS